MTSNIKQAWIDFCIISTVTLIAFIVVNILSYSAIIVRNAYVSHLPMVSIYGEKLEHAVSGAYPGLSFGEIMEIYEDTTALDLELENFTMFTERKGYESNNVNVSKDGYRLVADQESINTDRKKVFVFGSSPVFGYNLRDQDTIASHLQNIAGENFAVFNFGRGYYYSRQQFSLLINLVLDQGLRPDYVVFINNHSNERGFLGPATERGFQKFTENTQNFLFLREVFPVIKVLQYIGREYIGIDADVSKKVEASVEQNINYFLNVNNAVKSFADENKIEFISIYGPAYGYNYKEVSNDPLNRPEAKYDVKSLEIFSTIDSMFSKNNMPDYFYNFLDANNAVERPYVDTAHYSSALSREIAKGIYGIINERSVINKN